MSEILTIDTAAGVQQIERVDPLQVFGEDYFMLGQKIPDDNEDICWFRLVCESVWHCRKNVCDWHG